MFYRSIITIVIALFMSACTPILGEKGIIHDRSGDFREARNGVRLQVPTPLSAAKVSDYYVVHSPRVEYGATPVPPGSMLEQVASIDVKKRPPLPRAAFALQNRDGEMVMVIKQRPARALYSVAAGFNRRDISVVALDKQRKGLLILDTFQTFDKVTSKTPTFQALLSNDKQGSVLRLRTTSNKRLNAATAKRLLADLEQGLIGRYKSGALTRMFTG